MASHKKGKGCTIQCDPFQTQMAEHQALKHFGSVKKQDEEHGEGWMGDMAKSAFKHVAPHVIDWGVDQVKNKIKGMGTRPKKHAPLVNTLTVHSTKHGGSASLPEEIIKALPTSVQNGIESTIDTVLGIKPNQTQSINSSNIRRGYAQTVSKPYRTPNPRYNSNQLARIQMASTPGFISSHPKFLANHPAIASAIIGSGKNKINGRGKGSGGALFPAGYKKEHGEGSKIGRPIKCKGNKCEKEGDGFFGSILGSIAGDLLPF